MVRFPVSRLRSSVFGLRSPRPFFSQSPHLQIHSFTHSLIHSFTHLLIYSFAHLHICTFANLLLVILRRIRIRFCFVNSRNKECGIQFDMNDITRYFLYIRILADRFYQGNIHLIPVVERFLILYSFDVGY